MKSRKRITYSIGNGMVLYFNFPLDIGVVDMLSFMSFLTHSCAHAHKRVLAIYGPSSGNLRGPFNVDGN